MVFLLSVMVFLLVALMLGIGFIVAGKRIRGSCGGLAVVGPDGESLSCDSCPNRDKNPDCKNKS